MLTYAGVFCRFLSDGNNYTDCGHPCETNTVLVVKLIVKLVVKLVASSKSE
jgi:hypothetical protein